MQGGDENGQYAKFFSKTFDAETANKSAQNGPLDFVLAYTSEERGREFGHGITHWKKEMLS